MTIKDSGNSEKNVRMVAVGLLLAVIGLVAFKDLLHARADRVLPSALFILSYLGLPILFVGAVTIFRGMGWLKGRGFARTLLSIGIAMLAVGGFPWVYTDLLVGGRPGNEASGMLGTILFILVGVPGLVVTVTALVLRSRQLKKENRSQDS
ncbi:hypothetical protein WCX18_03535 [Sulfurimonas sp. HSL1-2]|uniref:hypothetical protein n=1 Tax=Thiomicrolovo zhangzhouensis TaxID=3131933 RepID=UPI0031F90FC0